MPEDLNVKVEISMSLITFLMLTPVQRGQTLRPHFLFLLHDHKLALRLNIHQRPFLNPCTHDQGKHTSSMYERGAKCCLSECVWKVIHDHKA